MGDFLYNIIKDISSSEILVLGFITFIYFLYIKFIKPDQERLKEYDSFIKDKISKSISLEDLKSLKESHHDHLAQDIVSQIKVMQEEILSDFKEGKLRPENIQVALEEEFKRINDIIDGMVSEFYTHQEKIDISVELINEVKKTVIVLYEAIDNTLLQLENKGYIEKVPRTPANQLNHIYQNSDLNTITDLLKQVLSKTNNVKPTSKLGRIAG